MGILTRAGAGRHGRRGTALLAGTALALITVAMPAGTAVASSQLWKVQKTANHTVPNGTAGAVSCPSADACEAVGGYRNTSGVSAPLAESWNGTAWTLQAAPIPAGADISGLDAVSCTAAASCEAVGSQSGSSGTTALAEAWNGTAWVVQSIPDPAGGAAVSLTGISCASADDCEAVGNYNSSTVPAILAERWNGTSWSIQVIPDPGASSYATLSEVSCPAANDCEAVGADSLGPFAEVWNGTTWSAQSTPAPGGINSPQLEAVSCASAGFCEAVGFGVNSASHFVALAEAWNGTSWSGALPPDPAANTTELQGVSCVSPSFCAAVGYTTSSGTGTLGEGWNGTSWAIEQIPEPAGTTTADLLGISCAAATACETAGQAAVPAIANMLIDGWNGTSWTLQAPVQPIGATSNSFSAASCVSATDCEAVGSYDNASAVQVTLAEAWNGTSWKIQATPNPAKGSTITLTGVSCVSASFCEASGSNNNGSAAFAEKWNGTAWQHQSAPGAGGLAAVSCVSASFCEAVGTKATKTGTGPLAETWNGTAWSTQAIPAPAGASLSAATGVSCTSAALCEAVGTYNENTAFAAIWNGSSWKLQTVPSPTGAIATVLSGVSCPAAGACEATGLQESSSGSGPLAEVWNGTAWAAQATPLPAGSVAGSLAGVSCTSAGACTAAGYYYNASETELSLAEVWNGTSWTVQSTPSPGPADSPSFTGVSCGAAGACTAVGSALDRGESENATLAEAGD
jgi:hypothetical protein